MKRLHFFTIKSYLGPLFATFFICMFILLMQFLWMYIDDIVGKGLETSVIIELLFYISIGLVPMALPLSVLLASIMTFGNLGENYELIACKASGISLLKVMKPLIALTVLMTFFAFFFSNNIVPYANLKGNVLLYDIKKTKPEMIIKEGVFTELQDFNIKVSKVDKETGMLYDLIIYNHKGNKLNNNEVIVADSGRINMNSKGSSTEFILYNGSRYKEEKAKDRSKSEMPYSRVYFGEQIMITSSSAEDFKRSDESLFSDSYRMLNVVQLDIKKDTLSKALESKAKIFAKRRLAYDYLNHLNHKNPKDTLNKDNVKLAVANIDSLLLSASIDEKSRISEMSLRKARQLSSQIQRRKREYEQQSERIRRYEIEWHKKFTLSLACLIFFFIGAPLGGIIRKGGLGMPVVVSILFFIIYYVISMTGERSAREGIFTSFEGVWLSTFIVLPLGIILTWQAVSDAKILNSEVYINLLRKIGLYKDKVQEVKKIENIESIEK